MSAPEPIGVATLRPDRTLVLQLRAAGPGGARGDAQLEFPPTHPRYAELLKHVGALQPGESKPVPPWP